MKHARIACVAAALAAMCLASPARAELRMVLDIDNGSIPGSSMIMGYEDWVDVSEFGVSVSATQGSLQFSPMYFSGPTCKASPYILQAVLFSNQFSWDLRLELVETVWEGKVLPVAVWELDRARFIQYSAAASPGTPEPMDAYAALFTSGLYRYNEYDQVGNPTGYSQVTWNLGGGTSFSTSGTVDNFKFYTGTLDAPVVPEPAGAALLAAAGLTIIGWRACRKRRRPA